MTEKGLVSRVEVGLMIASESEKAFGENPTQSFGEAKKEEIGLKRFSEGEGMIEGLSVIRVGFLSTATNVL